MTFIARAVIAWRTKRCVDINEQMRNVGSIGSMSDISIIISRGSAMLLNENTILAT